MPKYSAPLKGICRALVPSFPTENQGDSALTKIFCILGPAMLRYGYLPKERSSTPQNDTIFRKGTPPQQKKQKLIFGNPNIQPEAYTLNPKPLNPYTPKPLNPYTPKPLNP